LLNTGKFIGCRGRDREALSGIVTYRAQPLLTSSLLAECWEIPICLLRWNEPFVKLGRRRLRECETHF
jgi:hypothetical protein